MALIFLNVTMCIYKYPFTLTQAIRNLFDSVFLQSGYFYWLQRQKNTGLVVQDLHENHIKPSTQKQLPKQITFRMSFYHNNCIILTLIFLSWSLLKAFDQMKADHVLNAFRRYQYHYELCLDFTWGKGKKYNHIT